MKDATQAVMTTTFGAPGNPRGMLYNWVEPGESHVFVYYSGHDAPIRAPMRADEMLEKGDLDGQAAWKRILKAVDELLAEERPKGAGGGLTIA